MTVEDIICNWIESALAQAQGPIVIASSDIQEKCRSWGLRIYDKVYSPTTYQRAWRRLRSKHVESLHAAGVDEFVKERTNTQAKWIISPQANRVLTNHENGMTTTMSA